MALVLRRRKPSREKLAAVGPSALMPGFRSMRGEVGDWFSGLLRRQVPSVMPAAASAARPPVLRGATAHTFRPADSILATPIAQVAARNNLYGVSGSGNGARRLAERGRVRSGATQATSAAPSAAATAPVGAPVPTTSVPPTPSSLGPAAPRAAGPATSTVAPAAAPVPPTPPRPAAGAQGPVTPATLLPQGAAPNAGRLDYGAATAAAEAAAAKQQALTQAVGQDLLQNAPAGVQAELKGVIGTPPSPGATAPTAPRPAAGATGLDPRTISPAQAAASAPVAPGPVTPATLLPQGAAATAGRLDYGAATAAAEAAAAKQQTLAQAVGQDLLQNAPAGVQAEMKGALGMNPEAGAAASGAAASGTAPATAAAGGSLLPASVIDAQNWLRQRWAMLTPEQRLAAQLGGTGVAALGTGLGIGALGTYALSNPSQPTIITR